MALQTLKKRPEFLAVRGGTRASVPVCLIEAKPRRADAVETSGARFGFTITKKLGNAVVRNRIRRRLKAGLSAIETEFARAGYDYVIVARLAALDRPFASLVEDLKRALTAIHSGQPERRQERSVKSSRAIPK